MPKNTTKTPTAADPKPKGAGVVGTVEMLPLSSVKPNPWNPNRMTDFEKESLKTGLEADGWLSSQALLIWGTDDDGEEKGFIIDGEHRWTAATELGFPRGPMVVLKGLSEAKAKALTVKMNSKRGTFREDLLGELLRDIQFDLDVPNLSTELGIADDELMKLLADLPEVDTREAPPELERLPQTPEGPGAARAASTDDSEPAGPSAPTVRMVQLFLDTTSIETFTAQVKELGERYGTKTTTDTVMKALAAAVEAG